MLNCESLPGRVPRLAPAPLAPAAPERRSVAALPRRRPRHLQALGNLRAKDLGKSSTTAAEQIKNHRW